MVDCIDTDKDLTVGTEKTFRIQLFHQFIQRQIDDMFLTFPGNSKRHFILGIKVGNIRNL